MATTLQADLQKVSQRLRGELDRRRYNCLSSLLYDLGVVLLADFVGIIEDDPTQSAPAFLRILPVVTPDGHGFSPDRIPTQALQRVLREPRFGLGTGTKRRPSDGYERCLTFYFSPDEIQSWGLTDPSLGYWLVLVPVWPSHFWHSKPRSCFSVYVCNPQVCLGGMVGDSAHLSWELLRLCVEWFAWKHDRLSNRARILDDCARDPERVVQAVEATMVRPVLPIHLNNALSMLCNPRPPDLRWSMHSAELWGFAQRVYQAGTSCGANASTDGPTAPRCHGCAVSELCPQSKEQDELNHAITQLFLWRTGFWHDVLAPQSETFNKLLVAAISGLRFASHYLDRHQGTAAPLSLKPPLSLKYGRDRLLLRFFVARAIDDCLTRFDANQHEAVQIQLREAQLLARLAQLAVLLITKGEWTPEAIRNLIHVIADYGHIVLGVPSWLDLARHLRQTLRGESALYTLKQRYRDHFFHTIEVCLLGYSLLISRPDGASAHRLHDRILLSCAEYHTADHDAGPRFIPKDSTSFLAQWWVAALLHDTAYGIDVLGGTLQLLDYFKNLKNQTALPNFTKHVQDGVKKLHDDLAKDFPELADDRSVAKGDHGLIAASHLVETVRQNGESFVDQFLPAARAIAFHNTKHPRIDAGRDPVAALLVLCDTIQDWSRSQLGFGRSPEVVLSRLVSSAPTPEDEQFGPVQQFAFSMTPTGGDGSRPHQHVWDNLNELDITLEYGARAIEGTSIFFTWADTTHNLRRVDYSAWGMRIRIHHLIPLPGVDSSRPTKLAEFAELVRHQEAGFLESWVTTALSGQDEAPVRHSMHPPKNPVCEMLTFNLTALAKPQPDGPLMGRSLGDFGNFLNACPKGDSIYEDTDPQQRSPV